MIRIVVEVNAAGPAAHGPDRATAADTRIREHDAAVGQERVARSDRRDAAVATARAAITVAVAVTIAVTVAATIGARLVGAFAVLAREVAATVVAGAAMIGVAAQIDALTVAVGKAIAALRADDRAPACREQQRCNSAW
jgi:hypothetical protein